MSRFLSAMVVSGFYAWISFFGIVAFVVICFCMELQAFGLIEDNGMYHSQALTSLVYGLMAAFTALIFLYFMALEYRWVPNNMFLVSLVDAVFWSWIAFTILIVPVVLLGLGALIDYPNEIRTSRPIYRNVSFGITGILFLNLWVRGYTGTWYEFYRLLRMKWDLRGI